MRQLKRNGCLRVNSLFKLEIRRKWSIIKRYLFKKLRLLTQSGLEICGEDLFLTYDFIEANDVKDGNLWRDLKFEFQPGIDIGLDKICTAVTEDEINMFSYKEYSWTFMDDSLDIYIREFKNLGMLTIGMRIPKNSNPEIARDDKCREKCLGL